MTSAHQIIKRCIIGGYASFLSMAAVCFLLHPQILDNYTYGISYFGSVPITMVPYYLGFAGTIACMLIVAWQLLRFGQRALPLQVGFALGSILMAGVAITSYSVSDTVFFIHLILCLGLVLNEAVLIFWIVLQKDASGLDYGLALLFAVTVIISVLPLIHDLTIIRSFPLRELIIFVCALGLAGRAALRIK